MIKVILTDKAKELQAKGIDVQPRRGTPLSAGMDLAACIDEPVTIYPGVITKIYTGLKIYLGDTSQHEEYNLIDDGSAQLAGLYLPRSSNSELVLANTIGLLDCDFQGESFLKVTARENSFVINPGDKIAQLVIFPTVMYDWVFVDSFEEVTERGEGGDGSTGSNYTHG